MTYKELKSQIRDLGFEYDDTIEESKDLVANSCNRALNIIIKTVVPKINRYKGEEYDPPTNQITDETEDDDTINIPSEVEDLVSLLAGYYVWLDDDERKAVMYYNQYDDLKNEIFGEISAPTATLKGGHRFG